MDVILNANISHHFVIAAILFFAAIVIREYLCIRPDANKYVTPEIPYVEVPGAKDLRVVLKKGRQLYPGQPFMVSTFRYPMVIFPKEYAEEVLHKPYNMLNVHGALIQRFLGQHTGIVNPYGLGDAMQRLVKTDLTRLLDDHINLFVDELPIAFLSEIGECATKVWMDVCVPVKFQRVIGRLSGRVLAGAAICHNKMWLDTVLRFITNVVRGSQRLYKLPSWSRPLAVWVLGTRRTADDCYKIIAELIEPEFQALRNSSSPKFAFDANTGVIGGRMASSWKGDSQFTANHAAWLQLHISFASVFPCTMALTHIIYELAIRPEYQASLLEEINTVLSLPEHNGNLDKQAMAKMIKLDSFTRECVRLNDNTLTHGHRKILKPVTLKSGLTLARETHIAFDFSNATKFKGPEEFQPDRFIPLQTSAIGTEEADTDFSTANVKDVPPFWGIGHHICPGRFFAGAMIKTTLIYLLRNFEMRFKDNQPVQKVYMGPDVEPDLTKVVQFKKR